MLDWFFKKVTVASAVPALITAAVLLAVGRPFWGAGILAGFCWIYLNCFFLFRLIETAFSANNASADRGGKAITKNTVFALSILKFPVLYAAGFFILKSRVFPTTSILIGLTIFIAAFVIAWLVANPTRSLERSAS